MQTDAASPVATHSPVISCLVLVPESGATYSLSLPLFHGALHRSLHPPPLLYSLHSHHFVLHASYLLTLGSVYLAVKTSRDREREEGEDGRKSNVNVLVKNKMLKLAQDTSNKVIMQIKQPVRLCLWN